MCLPAGRGGVETFDVAANEVPKTKEEVDTILAIVKVKLQLFFGCALARQEPGKEKQEAEAMPLHNRKESYGIGVAGLVFDSSWEYGT